MSWNPSSIQLKLGDLGPDMTWRSCPSNSCLVPTGLPGYLFLLHVDSSSSFEVLHRHTPKVLNKESNLLRRTPQS